MRNYLLRERAYAREREADADIRGDESGQAFYIGEVRIIDIILHTSRWERIKFIFQ